MRKPADLKKYPSMLHVIFLLTACIVFLVNNPAASAADTGQKLSDIQDKLRSKLDALKDTAKKEQSVSAKLEDINKNIRKKEQELQRYNKQISDTQSEIQTLTEDVNDLTAKLESNMQYLKDVIIAYYKQQYDSNALILLSANDYQDLIQKMKYASLIAHYDSTVISEYGEEIKRISVSKKKLEEMHIKLRADKEVVDKSRSRLYEDSQEKDKLLAKLKAKRSMYEKNIKELEESSRKVQTMLEGIKSESIPQSITGEGFSKLKGRLPWPVEGEIMVQYREDKEPGSDTSALKSGVEIKAGPEAPPTSIAGGRVVFADSFKGYGKVVIIDHGNGYHSLYGNLAEISLQKGNIVIQGFNIGKINTSKNHNVPTLYFEIRYRGKPVNPMDWLKSRPASSKS